MVLRFHKANTNEDGAIKIYYEYILLSYICNKHGILLCDLSGTLNYLFNVETDYYDPDSDLYTYQICINTTSIEAMTKSEIPLNLTQPEYKDLIYQTLDNVKTELEELKNLCNNYFDYDITLPVISERNEDAKFGKIKISLKTEFLDNLDEILVLLKIKNINI